MITPRVRARQLRAALVGNTSAVVTLSAHTTAGGATPRGAALILTLLTCVTAAATLGSIGLEGRRGRPLGVMGALCLAQFSGHITLVAAGGHHHPGSGLGLTPAMVAGHIAAAVVLGAAITAVEYLYVVGVSVLCWLRLFATPVIRPASRPTRTTANVVLVQPVLLFSGLGMRAPPRRVTATATAS